MEAERQTPIFAAVIEDAEANALCMRWGWTTCGSGPFRDRVLASVSATVFDKLSANRIDDQIEMLEDPDADAPTFPLRWTGNRLGERKMLETLGSGIAGSHYRRMLVARDAANARREDERLAQSPENVARLRAAKAAQRQTRHRERLRAKAVRDARLRAEGKI